MVFRQTRLNIRSKTGNSHPLAVGELTTSTSPHSLKILIHFKTTQGNPKGEVARVKRCLIRYFNVLGYITYSPPKTGMRVGVKGTKYSQKYKEQYD